MAMSFSLFWKWYDKISLFQSQPLERKAFFFHYGRQNDLSGWMSRKHAQKKETGYFFWKKGQKK